MVITIKKDGDMIVIDEQRSDDTTIKYNTDVIIKLIEGAIESLTKERKDEEYNEYGKNFK